MVTTNWLQSLGVQPLLGRNFAPEESQTSRDPVVILTEDYWRRKFGSDPHIVGKTLTLDRNSYSVIGVLPPNVLRSYADVLKPLVTSTYSDTSLDLFGRLKPGVSAAQAQVELQSIGVQIERRNRHLSVKALGKHYAPREQKVEHGLVLILGAVGLVLLIACANVANLLLSRSAMRSRECLIRSALGASRHRLIRQFMIESMLLFCFGGAVGIAAAYLSVDALAALAAAGGYVPQRMAVTMDVRVVVISFLVTLLTGIGFGLAPALQASQVDLNRGLRDAGYSLTAGMRRIWTRRLLIVSELALSLILLVGFGLLIRSFYRIYAESAGFDPEAVLVTASDEGRSFTDAAAFWRTALERTHALPGVLSVSVTSRPPVHRARTLHFRIEGFPEIKSEQAPEAGDILISADYFSTLGIPIVSGRAFTGRDSENSPPVVIISQTVAGRYFPDQNPIGKRVQLAEQTPLTCCLSPAPLENVWREIVGVVGDVRQANLDDAPALTLYRPYTQIVEHDMFLMLRAATASDASRIAGELRPLLLGIDRQKEWTEIQSMLQVIHDSESIRLRRFVLILLGAFAGLALVLAAVGVYGVTATAVAERTREMGVRIALGATRTDLFREVLSEVMGLAEAGLAIGLIISMLFTRLVSTMLFGISRVDTLTYTGVTVVLTAAVLMAAYVPARRATRVDPTVALRHD
jgi:putative ABC transport system permease protein